VLVGEIELNDGASFEYKGKRYTIVSCKSGGRDLKVKFLVEKVVSWLHEGIEEFDWRKLTAVLVNREKEAVLTSNGSSGGGTVPLGFYQAGFREYTYQRDGYYDRQRQKSVKPLMDKEFASGAKLYFVDFEEGGKISLPFEIPDVELER
jgi:hypothetical protein